MANFHPLEVVGGRRETQLQVGKYLSLLILRFKGYMVKQSLTLSDTKLSFIIYNRLTCTLLGLPQYSGTDP